MSEDDQEKIVDNICAGIDKAIDIDLVPAATDAVQILRAVMAEIDMRIESMVRRQ